VAQVAAVRASGLVKRFESTCAVDGVDLLVGEGEVRGLLGPNGAGKTTLLRLLFGLLAPDAGDVELLGRPLGATENVSLEGVAGFVEEPAFYPYLSGWVNLELLAELDRSPSARSRVEEVLEQVRRRAQGAERQPGRLALRRLGALVGVRALAGRAGVRRPVGAGTCSRASCSRWRCSRRGC
jgi:ABC-2 type transport system ATP-binding protein